MELFHPQGGGVSLLILFFFFFKFILFIYFWLALGPRCCARAFSSCGEQASHCSGFSHCGARALGMRAPVVVACRLSSCGSQAQLLCSMWNLPRPGLEPVSPALAGGLSTTVPPGKSHYSFFKLELHIVTYFQRSQYGKGLQE